jgi:flavin-dependent dehydrogenase
MKYDIAIVGGGPAGAMTAIQASSENEKLRILLIDGQTEAQSKVCGGLLSHGAQKFFAKIGWNLPNSVLEGEQFFSVETVDLIKHIERNYFKHYFNMNRYEFDKWLLSKVGNNVKIVHGRCTKISEREDGFGLSVSSDGITEEFFSDFLVGADGASSIVRRTFFKKKPYKYVAIQQWFKDSGEGFPHYACIYDPKTTDTCSWIIKKGEYIIFGGAFKNKNCRASFEEQKKRYEEYKGRKLENLVKTEACLVTSPRSVRDFRLGGEKVFLVGEAGGFISSSSYEGISSALISGKALGEALGRSDNPKKIMKQYKAKTRGHRFFLFYKIVKMRILCCSPLRRLILRSGIFSIKKFKK